MAVVESVLAVIGLVGLGAAGLVLFVAGSYMLARVGRAARDATVMVLGRVTGHEVSGSDEGDYYYPLVEFEFAGRQYQCKGQLGRSRSPQHPVGKLVEVWLPPGRPEKAQLGRWEGWWLAAGVAFTGAAFVLAVLTAAARWAWSW